MKSYSIYVYAPRKKREKLIVSTIGEVQDFCAKYGVSIPEFPGGRLHWEGLSQDGVLIVITR